MIGVNHCHSKCICEEINNNELMELIINSPESYVHGTYTNLIDKIMTDRLN
jgi:hypothetical protein